MSPIRLHSSDARGTTLDALTGRFTVFPGPLSGSAHLLDLIEDYRQKPNSPRP